MWKPRPRGRIFCSRTLSKPVADRAGIQASCSQVIAFSHEIITKAPWKVKRTRDINYLRIVVLLTTKVHCHQVVVWLLSTVSNSQAAGVVESPYPGKIEM